MTDRTATAVGLACSVCDNRWLQNLDADDPLGDLTSSPVRCLLKGCDGIGVLVDQRWPQPPDWPLPRRDVERTVAYVLTEITLRPADQDDRAFEQLRKSMLVQHPNLRIRRA